MTAALLLHSELQYAALLRYPIATITLKLVENITDNRVRNHLSM